MPNLKIASWNINSVRARTDLVARFLSEAQPDVLCLQETKVVDSDFPKPLFRKLGYEHLILCGQRMHHGIAILSRLPMREDDRFDWRANGVRAEPRGKGFDERLEGTAGDVHLCAFLAMFDQPRDHILAPLIP